MFLATQHGLRLSQSSGEWGDGGGSKAGLGNKLIVGHCTRGSYPTVQFASPSYFVQIALRVFQIFTLSDAARAAPPCPAPAC